MFGMQAVGVDFGTHHRRAVWILGQFGDAPFLMGTGAYDDQLAGQLQAVPAQIDQHALQLIAVHAQGTPAMLFDDGLGDARRDDSVLDALVHDPIDRGLARDLFGH